MDAMVFGSGNLPWADMMEAMKMLTTFFS
jgi:hypothetical protein